MDININKGLLGRYLELITLSGQHQNKEALFVVKKDKITTLIKSPSNAVGTKATIAGKFEDLGVLGIDDLALLKNSVDFIQQEEVKLNVNKNTIVISSGKTKASLMLRNADYIKNSVSEEQFKSHEEKASGNSFVLSSDNIANIVKAYNIIKAPSLKIIGKEKSVVFSFGRGDNTIETEVVLDKPIQPFTTTVDAIFIAILIPIYEPTTVSIKQDSPIISVKSKKDNIEVSYLIAPMVK
jgi:hypothetical protein